MNWDDLPLLLTLPEVCALTRWSLKGSQNRLALARFPIASLPGVRPYRFPRKHVRAFVEHGTVTATVVKPMRARRYPRAVNAS